MRAIVTYAVMLVPFIYTHLHLHSDPEQRSETIRPPMGPGYSHLFPVSGFSPRIMTLALGTHFAGPEWSRRSWLLESGYEEISGCHNVANNPPGEILRRPTPKAELQQPWCAAIFTPFTSPLFM